MCWLHHDSLTTRDLPMPPRIARLYFLVQGLAVILWWLMLLLRPSLRALFAIRDAPDVALLAFAPADLIILAGGSLATAVAHGPRLVPALAWSVAGATVYGALYTLTTAVAGSAPWIGAVLMASAGILSVIAAKSLTRETPAAISRDLPSRRPREPRS